MRRKDVSDMKRYRISNKLLNGTSIVYAKTPSKAKYKLWLKSASDSGYWKSFIDFCKSCKVYKEEIVV